MPEDEVDELDREASDEGKSRSAYIRSLIRSRHIEEQLEEQVLTQEDQQQYEQRIQQLKEERDQLRTKAEKADAVESTIRDTVDRSIQAVEEMYRERIEQLKAENEELREAVNDSPDEQIIEDQLAEIERDLNQTIKEENRQTRNRLASSSMQTNEHINNRADEIITETKRAGSLIARTVNSYRAIKHRLKIIYSRRKIK